MLSTQSLGNAGSNADAVRLEDCAVEIVDTVIYGPTEEDEVLPLSRMIGLTIWGKYQLE